MGAIKGVGRQMEKAGESLKSGTELRRGAVHFAPLDPPGMYSFHVITSFRDDELEDD